MYLDVRGCYSCVTEGRGRLVGSELAGSFYSLCWAAIVGRLQKIAGTSHAACPLPCAPVAPASRGRD